MKAMTLSIHVMKLDPTDGTGNGRAGRMFGAVVLALAVRFASCQVDSDLAPRQISTAQAMVVSKGDLRVPLKVQKVIDRAHKELLRGRYELAQNDVQRALDLCPHCALALTFQGIVNLRKGNPSEAASAFQQAIDADPSSGSAYLGMAIILNHQGRFKDAIAPLDRAAPLLTNSWLLHLESAWAHLGIGESLVGLREAISAEGLSEGDPERLAAVAYLRGIAHFQLQDFSGAKRYFEEAVDHDPKGTFAMLAQKRVEQVNDFVSKKR